MNEINFNRSSVANALLGGALWEGKRQGILVLQWYNLSQWIIMALEKQLWIHICNNYDTIIICHQKRASAMFERHDFSKLKKKKAFDLHLAEFALKCWFPVVSFLVPSFYIYLCPPGIKEALPCLGLYIICPSSVSYFCSLLEQKSW